MTITTTPIADLLIIEPIVWKDNRGYFYESYNQKKMEEAGIIATFVQDNQSLSEKGTLRGLHAQAPPFDQGKLVRVLQGSVFDVAVDIRKNSPTYGQHFDIELSDKNHLQLWIPPGFLHGFLALQDNTIFSYKVTNYYNKASEIGVIYNDSDLKIEWEQEDIKTTDFLLSEKDLILPSFKSFENPF